MSEPTIEDYYSEDRTSRRRPSSPPTRSCPTGRCTTRPTPTTRRSGPARPASCSPGTHDFDTDARVGPALRQVVRRRHAQRRRTTASTATSRPAAATRSPSTGRASRATPAPSPTPSCSTEVVPVRQRAQGPRASQTGDRVAIYMPMIPELPVAMLACTRIGAAHSVIFGGFSPDAIGDRVNDAEAKVVITADGGYRRGAPSRAQGQRRRRARPLRPPSSTVVVVDRCDTDVDDGRRPRPLVARPHGRRVGRLPARAHGHRGPALPALHLGHHGQAQGHHAHHRRLPHPGRVHPQVRLRPARPRPTSTGARPTSAGSPATATSSTARSPTAPRRSCTRARPTRPPEPRRPRPRGRGPLWDIIERYGVTQLYTAPTAIRTFMKWGDRGAGRPRPVVAARARHRRRADQPRGVDVVPRAHRRRALPDRRHVVADRDRRPHDHAAARASPPPSPARPPSRCPASCAEVVDDDGNAVERGGGYLTLTRPWPAMLRGIWGDPERYRETYWSRVRGPLLRRRRRQDRRRRLPLAARAGSTT